MGGSAGCLEQWTASGMTPKRDINQFTETPSTCAALIRIALSFAMIRGGFVGRSSCFHDPKGNRQMP
eukprot:2212210-Amphidinium_carterae.1